MSAWGQKQPQYREPEIVRMCRDAVCRLLGGEHAYLKDNACLPCAPRSMSQEV